MCVMLVMGMVASVMYMMMLRNNCCCNAYTYFLRRLVSNLVNLILMHAFV